MSTLTFTTPLPPSVNEYRKYRVMKNGRFQTVQTYKSTKTKEYEAIAATIIRNAMNEQGWVTPSKDRFVNVNVTFYFARINQDDNNYYKVALDVMEEVGAIYNDCKVMIRTQDIFVDSKNPRMEVELVLSDKIGIFKDESELEKYKIKNCLTCSKENSKCSVMKKCLENRVNCEEIDNKTMNCLKKRTKTT